MSASVWVYPEKKYEQLGAVRYEVSWEEVKKEAQHKLDANEDIDPDIDIAYLYKPFKDKEKAGAFAKKVVASGVTAYGAATVIKQIVDWYVEEDRIAEWADTSEQEEFSS